MTKSKKHSPKQSEQGSLVEQAASSDKMQELVNGLVELAEERYQQSLAEGSILDTDRLISSSEDLPKLK